MAFLQIFVSQQLWVFFKTSGYNVECDELWDWSNRSLVGAFQQFYVDELNHESIRHVDLH